jgi:hypothetical protein
MLFPLSFDTLTIPTGAGPTTSRLFIGSDGSLTSFDFASSPPKYAGLFQGAIWLGPLNASLQPDYPNSAFIEVANDAVNPSLTIGSPISSTKHQGADLFLQPGNASTHGILTVGAPAGPVAVDIVMTGDILSTGNLSLGGNSTITGNETVSGILTASNIQFGLASVTTVVDQWVEVDVTFPHAFNSVPQVFVMGNNQGPAVGSSANLEYAVTVITTTGCAIRVMRGTVSTMNIAWLAIAAS